MCCGQLFGTSELLGRHVSAKHLGCCINRFWGNLLVLSSEPEETTGQPCLKLFEGVGLVIVASRVGSPHLFEVALPSWVLGRVPAMVTLGGVEKAVWRGMC